MRELGILLLQEENLRDKMTSHEGKSYFQGKVNGLRAAMLIFKGVLEVDHER